MTARPVPPRPTAPARRAASWRVAASGALCLVAAHATGGAGADPRLLEVTYDPHAVVTVPVQRGVVTLIVLDADEAIAEVGAGLGSDCTQVDAAWCIATQRGGHTVFVKPKSLAREPNTLAVVTDRRVHAFRFVLVGGDTRPPVYRLLVKAPAIASPRGAQDPATLAGWPDPTLRPSPQALVVERLQAPPRVANANYTIAPGEASDDIVPTLIFDDGRFTYLRLPGNRDLPSVFQVLADGSETLVNTRMEDDLLVVDRVSRRLMLRAGSAVVGVWNEAFDIEGGPPGDGTTVPGVRRALKGSVSSGATLARPALPLNVPTPTPTQTAPQTTTPPPAPPSLTREAPP